MGRVVMNEEKRNFSRIALRCPATLNVNGIATACELRDISLRGARVQVPSSFDAAAGDPCVLIVRLDTGMTTIRMSGVIAHSDSGSVGICCRDTDLDSAIHLRRLLEVNLAEERLLDRELGALLASRQPRLVRRVS